MSVRLIETVTGRTAGTLSEFMQALLEGYAQPMLYRTSDFLHLDNVVKAAEFGKNAFAEKESLINDWYSKPIAHRQGIEFVSLPYSLFSPYSYSVIASGNYLYKGALDTSAGVDFRLESLATFDPIFRNEGGDISISSWEKVPYVDKIAMPICGPGAPNFGHFLMDGLGAALALKSSPYFNDDFTLVGGHLASWQEDILDRLGLLKNYTPLPSHTTFRVLLANTMLYGHLQFPTRFVRPVFDLLRIGVAVTKTDQTKIFINRGVSKKRFMRNRSQVEEMLIDYGFRIVDPTITPMNDIVQEVSNARVVVGEGGAGMAHVAFCETGAKVLEIQPSTFPDGWTRQTCGVFGLDWYLCACAPDVLSDHDISEGIEMAYSVNIDVLKAALREIDNDKS
ncbi:glycosyltransferase family 61 protein [Phyllobacterium zundukense]|uniref:Glycosyltransferase family 61 protein n=1 Tax=Phyllobacterium zundukense TaxID=1867719 RepID=A0ACD4CZJ7_9HYPH|nr:glycosyltransferase family 61 protein [Phyllobacterium zundukense]UXN58952.1 glycosyltransferase family 61 protein [Phyllobacterium zundukense]